MDRQFFAGKDVLVMGLGRFGGGVDAAKFAAEAGAKVTVTDLASEEELSSSIKQLEEFPDIEYHLGSHDPADFKQADVIIANPAVPPDNKFLEFARGHNKFITSQINIFFELCPAPIIGITGANGKSTTAALIAYLLKSASNYNVWLSGNIGNEPLLTITDQIKPGDLVVLELSSFQIEQLAQIPKAPNVALLTNLTPNHLDRYGTFANYCAAKENIFKFQKLDSPPAVSIFNAEDEIAAKWFEKYRRDAGRICVKFSADDVSKEIRDSFPLPGRANLSNLAAALCIARHFGVEDRKIIKELPKFKGLPHRLEFAAEINGVKWYNDSKATTPESAITAIEAFDQPVIIIAGGYDKHIPFDEFGQKIAKKAKAAILLGQTAPKIADVITACPKTKIKIEIVDSLPKAVELAKQLAANGDVVLLSPACASYDMFGNYEQRGNEFCKLVRENRG
ncbi:MAG: UDP-N-acetylmuramoyl-L-alanine--D-glutamate ligase [Phycisphaerae bacterium]|nr:UDP-N-acetylmuramoyl-L-alanine--D-glutamate ligase [Phycisphaerae bacterium]MDD5380581.1 UDP-N-acetylmuramoyl-L-alanine--D-glutamate ligase [Phycisphaerae bacterium]